MRIVHVTNAYAPGSGGARTTVHAVGTGYRARGHDLVLVTPGARDRTEDRPWGQLVQVAGLRVPGTGGYCAMVDRERLRRTIAALGPDRLEVSDRFTVRHLGPWAPASRMLTTLIARDAAAELDRIGTPNVHVPLGFDLEEFGPDLRARSRDAEGVQLVLCTLGLHVLAGARR